MRAAGRRACGRLIWRWWERSFNPAFHLALQAHSDEAKVLQIDPDYVDAKLVVGTYQYVIGALPWGFKLLFGFAGITGSKSKGMELLHDDFARGPMTSVEAGTVIALFLRRGIKVPGSDWGGSRA